MKISIALTTFNGATYLQAQLDSYLAQDRQPDELVVCDDLSTDETIAILERFRKSATFEVQVIVNKTNLGFTRNFEKTLSSCTGDLIFLSDQDDIWFPEKIRVIEDAYQKNPDKYLFVHDGDLVDENLVSYGVTKRGQVLAGYGSDDHLCTGALTAVHKDLIQFAFPIPAEVAGHDGWLHSVARLLDKRLVIDQSLQLIRRHSQNTSAWVASSVKPVTRLTVARSQFSTTPSISYKDRVVYNSNLADRLLSLKSLNQNEVSVSTITMSLAQLAKELKAITHREELLRLGFLRRKIRAVSMLACGDYAYFNGMKSFLRDLFR